MYVYLYNTLSLVHEYMTHHVEMMSMDEYVAFMQHCTEEGFTFDMAEAHTSPAVEYLLAA